MMSEICRCPIGVGANRVGAARQILQQFPDTDVILSDDGLQHYALKRDIEIAVCRYMALGNGMMLPAGPLREPRSRLSQVDITINRDSDQVVESLGEVWNLAQPENRRTYQRISRDAGPCAGGYRVSRDISLPAWSRWA